MYLLLLSKTQFYEQPGGYCSGPMADEEVSSFYSYTRLSKTGS